MSLCCFFCTDMLMLLTWSFQDITRWRCGHISTGWRLLLHGRLGGETPSHGRSLVPLHVGPVHESQFLMVEMEHAGREKKFNSTDERIRRKEATGAYGKMLPCRHHDTSEWDSPLICLCLFLQPNFNILHVTPYKAILVECTEVSSTFNEEGIEGMGVRFSEGGWCRKEIRLFNFLALQLELWLTFQFYPDLYNLAMNHSSKQAIQKIENISFNLSETVCEMLCASRPLCFS